MKLNILNDPIKAIQNNPAGYCTWLPPSGEELSSKLIQEALVLGATNVLVKVVGNWWVIGAESDWIKQSNSFTVLETFHRIMPFPEIGINSLRYEVLLTAFCSSVLTVEENKKDFITGQSDKELENYLQSNMVDMKRIVAFKM